MAKGSDNPFPSVLFVEGTAPVAPSAGDQRLFIDSADHLPKIIDSSSNVSVIGSVLTAIVTLTDAQIKALPTTPISLVSAPGAGKRVRPIAVSLSLDSSAGAYTNINATYCDLHLLQGTDITGLGPVDDSTTSAALAQITATLGAASKTIYDLAIPKQSSPATTPKGYVLSSVYSNAQQANAVLQLASNNNGSGNFTGGNVANTLKVTVYYIIETL